MDFPGQIDMANLDQLAKLDDGVQAWNQWRASHAAAPDLSELDFSGRDLSHADLRGADLGGVIFNGSNLSGASLRETNLQGADLRGTKGGLRTEQLAGADLTGASLPDDLKKLYDGLQNANNISESARKLFLAVLAACLYSWLTIATTKDVNLLTNRDSSPLPIIQTSIPIVGFYVVAPLLLLCVYFYLHFYLQKLWEELSSLPAILPDGRPLHTRIDPWLLNDLVRAHLPKLNVNRPFLSYFQSWISVLLTWWVVPITMFLFWGRYLPRHERIGTSFHLLLLIISVSAAVRLYGLAVFTLRGAERRPFRWRNVLASRRGFQTAAFAVGVGAVFGALSWGAFKGVASDVDILGLSPPVFSDGTGQIYLREGRGPCTWVPRLMGAIGYSWFLDVRGAEVSQKKPALSKGDNDLDSVIGIRLQAANLRYASASRAFFAGANLDEADLTGADLTFADLRGSHLRNVQLSEAFLSRADLRDADMGAAHLATAQILYADLRGAQLGLADLRFANLGGADLRGAHLVGSNLSGADLNGVDLTDADLRADLSGTHLVKAHLRGSELGHAENANLNGADLRGAVLHTLNGADLRGADLSGANLTVATLLGAQLSDSNLTYSDFRGATNLNPDSLKVAAHWREGFYDAEMLRALGLPLDNNKKLAQLQEREKKLQKKHSILPNDISLRKR